MNKHGTHVVSVVLAGACAISSAAIASGAQDATVETQSYLRMTDSDNVVALEVASRTFNPADGSSAPVVELVGVAHIADASFYKGVQNLLDSVDIVLFESVMPSGARGVQGETHAEKVRATEKAMRFIAIEIEQFRKGHDRYPTDLAELFKQGSGRSSRLGKWLRNASIDAWGTALHYMQLDFPTDEEKEKNDQPNGFRLMSFGSDGRIGGEGDAADIAFADQTPLTRSELSDDDGLQADLAEALNLAFQLPSLSYERENWRCSDMTMDELDAAFAQHGLEVEPLTGTLAGSSLPAQIVKVLLNVLKFTDRFFGGALSEGLKIMLIEMLGDESITQLALQQFGPGFEEVIVDDRNQVVIDDMKTLIRDEPNVKSVAIVYGAAHLPDMEERLVDQLGYVPGESRWLKAIAVDMKTAALSQSDLRMIRRMIRTSLRQQMRAMRMYSNEADVDDSDNGD